MLTDRRVLGDGMLADRWVLGDGMLADRWVLGDGKLADRWVLGISLKWKERRKCFIYGYVASNIMVKCHGDSF